MKASNGRPIQIVHVLYVLRGGGGIQKWLVDILQHIDRDRFRMDFLVHVLDACPEAEKICALGSRIILCPHPKKYVWQPWLYDRTFKGILQKYGPYDIIHSHTAHFNGYILRLAKQIGLPVRIAHSHNDTTSSDAREGLFRRSYIAWTKSLIPKYATIGLGASRKATAYMFGSAWEDNPRYQTLYCGLDLNSFRNPVEPTEVRTELGIPADAFVIGHVGRLVEQKNHLFMLEIAAEVAKLQPKMHMLLVGDGELRPNIKQKVAQLDLSDRVIFAGVRYDVHRLMLGAMDVFLFPSLYEGLGLVLIEAQAAGLPCILSDVVPEEADIVKPLIQRISLSKSASNWAKAIVDARNSSSAITQSEALAAVENSHFNIKMGVKNLIDIYESNFSTL
ncbi:glycosyltransferase family 1 protein [Nostoc sp. 106C]|uniref:glycosyltransferase family 1 protein n=1 Tax=Nostoc sp. 106C TaxID=1932667 RepID=UPI000A387A9E|nr:glycosyltransferase family 1 protein [Nostoc sp. 106C]OUL27224.1 glycosyltransferase [Nostoc sp. RF31YmG]OUL33265.1 glycosyltransferase [Nostoc sp. 106C]